MRSVSSSHPSSSSSKLHPPHARPGPASPSSRDTTPSQYLPDPSHVAGMISPRCAPFVFATRAPPSGDFEGSASAAAPGGGDLRCRYHHQGYGAGCTCNVFVVEIHIGPSADVMVSIRVLRIEVPVRCCRAPNAGMAFEM